MLNPNFNYYIQQELFILLILLLLVKNNVIFAIPFIKSPTPLNIETVQNARDGRLKIIINPIINNENAANHLQEEKLKILRNCAAIEDVDILSKIKYTPVNATNHNKLIFGTNKSKIPIIVNNAPKNISKIKFLNTALLIKAPTILYIP